MIATHFKLLLSIFIAGILLVTLRQVHSNLSDSGFNKVSDTIAAERADEIVKLLSFDLNRIGLGVKGENAIVEAKQNKIVFKSDIDLDGVVETVRYFLSDTGAARSTPNPDDMVLYRIVDGEPERRTVTIGRRSPNLVEIVTGLATGDRVSVVDPVTS